MRSTFFTLTILLAACGHQAAPKPIGNAAVEGADAELVMACVPAWSRPPTFCPKDEEGHWILPEDDPTNPAVTQIMELERNYRSESMDRANVKLMTNVIEGGKASECGKRVCRWHRARALHRLGRWREAFMDFASVVKDGPNNPFYDDVGEWLTTLEPHVSREAMMHCWASYDATLLKKDAKP